MPLTYPLTRPLTRSITRGLTQAGGGGGAANLFAEETRNAVLFSSVNGQSLGQSNASGGGAHETIVQEYGAKAFPRGKTTTTYADLTAAVCTNRALFDVVGTYVPNSGEGPMFGVTGGNYEAGSRLADVAAEHYLVINNAAGSTTIALQQKGQTAYTSTIAGTTAAKNYATSIGKTYFDMGILWCGGESNGADTKATYQASLTQLAYDHSVDRQAITGQTTPPALFTYITPSTALNTAPRCGVGRAQHQAAIDYFNGVTPSGKPGPVPVILSTPAHFMSFASDATGVHIEGAWSYMLGRYAAEAQYHCYMKQTALPLNERYPPIHPIAVSISGAEMTVTYQLRVPGTSLEWGVSNYPNGEGIPEQEDYGFAAYDGATLVALNTPQIVAANQIKFTLASGTWADGYRLGYMLDIQADHHTYFKAGAGNLRDNYGDTVRCEKLNLPLHNWAAPIDIYIGPSSTWSIG